MNAPDLFYQNYSVLGSLVFGEAYRWAIGHRQTTPLIISALTMPVSRLNKDDKVILHSDQGTQYSSYDYKKFAK